MNTSQPFIDIHCHLVPGLDDGAKSWHESLAMAQLAGEDGIGTIVATPHQLGSYAHNDGETIRQRCRELQQLLLEQGSSMRVLPGADVRIDEPLLAGLRSGQVVTLADRGRHVLLELPHELYFSLEGVLGDLRTLNLVGILSHPERNQGLLKMPHEVQALVTQGCLMQVTAGSVLGAFGPACQQMAQWMLEQGLVHFLATDAHGLRARRPLLRAAFERVVQVTDEETAHELCCQNPAAVVDGRDVAPPRRSGRRYRRRSWLSWRKAG